MLHFREQITSPLDRITITIIDIIHRPILYLKNTTFRRPDSVFGLETQTSSFNWAHLTRFRLQSETESSIRSRKIVFLGSRVRPVRS
jgi:hypothetical protein